MTPAEAQKIIWTSSLYDHPMLVEKALEFALFKTYGIVSACRLYSKAGSLISAIGVDFQTFA
jgi:hypothetical protein